MRSPDVHHEDVALAHSGARLYLCLPLGLTRGIAEQHTTSASVWRFPDDAADVLSGQTDMRHRRQGTRSSKRLDGSRRGRTSAHAVKKRASHPLVSAAPSGSDQAELRNGSGHALAVGPHLAQRLWEQWRCYCKCLRRTQKKFSNPNVHDLRVQTRRLMAQLALIRCALRNPLVQKACRRLRRRLADLGELRDLHVQIAFLGQSSTLYPQVGGMCKHLKNQERDGIKSARSKLKRLKRKQLERCMRQLRADLRPEDPPRQAAMAKAVWRATQDAYDQLAARYKRINPAVLSSIHRTRVAFKRYRYVLESLPLDLPRPTKADLREMANYQRLMGEIQDMAVLRKRTLDFMADHKKAVRELPPFLRYLRRRTERLLRQYLAVADKLKQFSPKRLAATS